MTDHFAAFEQFAARLRPQIDAQLERHTRIASGCPDRLRAAMRHGLLAPGKRLRPLLVLSAAEICGAPLERAMPAACAVEMVHAYSLIHDDLPAMDNDDLRRGQPTCHKAFDEATAILAGDALLTQAFELLARDLEPAETARRCCVELAQAAGACQLVGGQADDLAAEQTGGDLDFLTRIHERKTGAMLVVSLRLGGLVGQASDEQLSHLTAYGKRLGVAFQIVDDLLDLTGDPCRIGKRTGQDVQRGKLTYPALLGLDASRQRAGELVEQAVGALATFGTRAHVLQSLARYVVQRNQ